MRKHKVKAKGITTAALLAVALTHATFAQPATRSTATRPPTFGTQVPSHSVPARFKATVTRGPDLHLRGADEKEPTYEGLEIQGPVWDGTNGGLWIMVSKSGSPTPVADALLIDPATGEERKRTAVAGQWLRAHDGVGLWYEAADGFRRVRTAGDVPADARYADRVLPEDVPSRITPRSLRAASTAPPVSTCNIFTDRASLIDSRAQSLLQCLYLDTLSVATYGCVSGRCPTQGAGWLWFGSFWDGRTSRLFRLPLRELRCIRLPTTQPALWMTPCRQDLPSVSSTAETADLSNQGFGWIYGLAWDGQRLWTVSDRDLLPRGSDGRRERRGEAAIPPHLVSIDVGLSRHADTTERYQEALAFEKANGTARALPLFEKIIADDPSAAEIRNHIAWALGTRPEEPYHNMDRAMALVTQALEWQPWNPEMWDTLAEIYWRKGDAQLAEHIEAKAINLNPHKNFYWQQYERFHCPTATQPAKVP